MRLDHDPLAARAAVVRHGSFERTAHALHGTPSAISPRIARLEDGLDQALVARGRPGGGAEAGPRLCTHADTVAALEHAPSPISAG